MRNRTAVLLASLVLSAAVHAEEWPQWRGPRGDGTSQEIGIPIHWSRTENIRWQVAIPGKGHSSPIVWGHRVFLTTCLEQEKQRLLLCLDRRDGRLLWQRVVLTAPLEPKHDLNSYASSTPATDGRHVWVTFEAPVNGVGLNQWKDPKEYPDLVAACYDINGQLVWRKTPGKFCSKHGFCSPPILYKDMVIINGDQDAKAYIVALDKTTGAERWRADRPNRTRSYCPPLIIRAAGRKQLVLSGSKCVASYDPDTGQQLWIIDGPTEQFVAGPVFLDRVVFVTAGFPEHHLIGIRPDGKGNVTRTKVLWHHTKGASYVPSPIAYDQYFYVVSDGGVASCLEAQSGKRLWMRRLGRHHSASPVAAGGYLYFPDDDGTTWVLKAGPEFKLVSKNALGEEVRASPAISHGDIFIRTMEHLYCIGPANTRQSRR